MKMRIVIACSLVMVASSFAATGDAGGGPAGAVWQAVDRAGLSQADLDARVRPTDYRVYRLTAAALDPVLAGAPQEAVVSAADSGAQIGLPLPDGSYAWFRFVESPVMAPALAAKYPAIRTYLGQGIDDPAATVRFDWTPAGFHAQILSPDGTVYIDPFGGADGTLHTSYYARDRVRLADAPWGDESLPALATGAINGNASRNGEWLYTYRLACAATGEYTIYHGGTVQLGLAAIVTAVNRVNGIYETDFAIRLELVPNNDLLVFTDPNTDPYTNDDANLMIDENQVVVDNAIGNANYDIGHVFATSPGGVSYTPAVCHDTWKAGGVTGTSDPIGDPFWVDYVAHEMGHQFNANHTFNSELGACIQRNATTAYEPGSGATIMAYAGICWDDDLQPNSDPYFHHASIAEVRDYVDNGWGASCGTETATGNTDPTVDAGADYVIPANTPFMLTATGNDIDGDTLTFCWEEHDLGPVASLGDPDDGLIPLFRSWTPTTDPTRTFPRLEDLVQNTLSLGEQMPTTDRTMNFRVTVRDNRAGGGGTAFDDMVVTVDTTGVFTVDEPNTGMESWYGPTEDVTWSSTTEWPPFNVDFVDVRLSLDGGLTYPYLLADDVLNGDGFTTVTLPGGLFSTAARVRVEAVGNIFFDISDADFLVDTISTIGDFDYDGDVDLLDLASFQRCFGNQPLEFGCWEADLDIDGDSDIDDYQLFELEFTGP